MSIEDQRSRLLCDKQKVTEIERWVDKQRAMFKQEMKVKEQQLQALVDQKQNELEHYESCLRKEAHDLAQREEKLEDKDRTYKMAMRELESEKRKLEEERRVILNEQQRLELEMESQINNYSSSYTPLQFQNRKKAAG